MKIIAVILILGLLGFAIFAFIFPFGRYTPLVDHVERQYGKSRAWLYIVLVAVILMAIRFWVYNSGVVDNPFYEGPK